MNWRTVLSVLLFWLAGGMAIAGTGSDAPERLDRFRQLAAGRLGAAEVSGQALPEATLNEIYGLLDDEIVENLTSGGPFASQAFLQDRLDAFNDAWGGTAFRILTLPGGELTVGAFQLSPLGRGNSVRIYDGRGAAGLVKVIRHEGVPSLQEMPATRTGDPQFLVAWIGPQSGRGNTSLRVELWRSRGLSLTAPWSTDAAGQGELLVSRVAFDAQELSFRYEVRYAGWKPGCAGQTEQEDFYRYVPARETFVLTRRRVHNGWHRELHAGVARFLSALNAGDDQALARLVSDRALRRKLPASLEADLACDEADGRAPSSVSVAAVEPAGGQPWTLLFRRTQEGWRLTGAVPLDPFSAKMAR